MNSGSIKLILASGPQAVDPIEISEDDAVVLGRSSACEVSLIDPNASISRKHLAVAKADSDWTVKDLGSRNGTQLNGTKLLPDFPTPIKHGDVIRLGSWVFRVNTRGTVSTGADSTMIHTLNDSDEGSNLVERVRIEPLANLASHRLAVLLECADRIHGATDIDTASKVALDAMIESSGYSRAVYLAPHEGSGQYQTLSFQSKNPLEDVSSVNFSQSLLEAAADGEVVRLTRSQSQVDYGQSIADLDIHSALCVPVIVDQSPIGFMYLDARGGESTVRHDSTAFGRAVGRLLGLTVSNLRSKELEIQQHAMQYDLDAAAKAQRLLLPPENGIVGPVSYAMKMRPGRLVAGDLFGVVQLKDRRVCTFLGDVSGKGAGAAIMMATTQSYIHAMFEQTSDIGEVMTMLNKHIADRSTGQFVTMWIGVIDIDSSGADVEFIDAGHGHWLVTETNADAARPSYNGGLVIGIDPEVEFTSETFRLGLNQRIVLFSDGVVEQTPPGSDDEYGLHRAGALLKSTSTHQDDVSSLLNAVLGFAQSDALRDDTTVASVGIAQ